MFGSSVVIFAVFGWWELRVSSPTVDLRTTVKRPVLTTNLASIAVAFGMFALALVAPQILELPPETGYGLGQSLLWTGLWMAPGGLAMMVTSPIAARVAAVRGPRFTLGDRRVDHRGRRTCPGLVLLAAPWQIMLLNILVSVGVGFAYASMPALINAAVPMSETAAANGINALARSLGTSISSAVIGAILAGHDDVVRRARHPDADRVAGRDAGGRGCGRLRQRCWRCSSPMPDPAGCRGRSPRRLRRTAVRERPGPWLEHNTYLMCDRIDEAGDVTLGELADEFAIDVPTASRHVAALLREGLATGAGRGDSLSFWLTPRGRDRLYQERAARAATPRPAKTRRDVTVPRGG